MENNMTPLEALRHHVSGAIERGEKEAIVGKPATRQWRYYSYDVWGNADDGYDVNNVFRTSDIVELPVEPMCDCDLFTHLVECGFFHGTGLRSSQFETGGDEETIYLTYKGKPEGELRLEPIA